jgi:hypothetical protein
MKRKSEDELKKIIAEARNQLDTIESKRIGAINKRLLGKCYRFRNSYSSDSKWWLYLKCVSVNGRELTTIQFEKDCYGKIEITQEKFRFSLSDSYQEITQDHFEQAWKELFIEVQRFGEKVK